MWSITMKWKNKGHEFDSVYENITHKKVFYLYGAGDYGNQFINIIRDEIEIAGYIDNDSHKQGKEINGKQRYGTGIFHTDIFHAVHIDKFV